jgi:hypothetical protein
MRCSTSLPTNETSRATTHVNPLIVRVGRRQKQENWGGLKRFLEAREELAPEAT